MGKPALVDVPCAAPADLQLRTVEDQPFWTIVGEGRPVTGERTDYVSTDERFYVGYSQYSKMTLELRDWPGDEFMYLIEGTVEITSADGACRTYGPGDMWVMPKGFTGTWKQLGPIRKINIIYDWGQ
jgi:uncharacterized cupin superfamily protein